MTPIVGPQNQNRKSCNTMNDSNNVPKLDTNETNGSDSPANVSDEGEDVWDILG